MRARLGAVLAMAALLSLGATGCAFVTPQATTKKVEVANGVNGTVGTIEIRNATLISNDGDTASMLVTFHNSDMSTRQLTVQYSSDGEMTNDSVLVAGDGSTSFGGKNDSQLILTGIDTQPGSLLPVFFQYGTAEGKQLLLPVLTTDFAEYEGLAPTPMPTIAKPLPGATPAPETTETQAPTTAP